MIRLFSALALPGDAAERLEGLQTDLEGRLVPRENLHVTLVFYGEVPEPVAEDLDAALSEIDAPGFDLWLDGVDAFGGAKPRAIYAAVRPEPALDRLQAKAAQAGRRAGLTLGAQRYTPHVTLSRYAPGALSPKVAAKRLAARAAFLAGPIPVRAFGLYASDLGRNGPIYTELARYPLRGAAETSDRDR